MGIKLNSNLRYRVVGVGWDLSELRPQRGRSCGHTWKGASFGTCPRCGDTPVESPDGQYHWLDRKTKQPLAYSDGRQARFNSLDEAIAAFVNGELEAKRNEPLY